MGVSKNWAKEEKRLRIEGVCSVACREKETTQLMGEQMGREAGPNLEPPPPRILPRFLAPCISYSASLAVPFSNSRTPHLHPLSISTQLSRLA